MMYVMHEALSFSTVYKVNPNFKKIISDQILSKNVQLK